jgi:hypothetical protein
VCLLVLFTRNFLTCFVHLYNDYCFPTSVVVVDATAMLNAKRGCNLSGRPIETVGLATFVYSTVHTLNTAVQNVGLVADIAV